MMRYLIFLLIIFSYNSGYACIDWGDQIELDGSPFQGTNKFTLHRLTKGDIKHEIRGTDGSAIFYDNTTGNKCWKTRGSSQERSQATCITGKIDIVDEKKSEQPVIGTIEFKHSTAELFFFTTNDQGEKDLRKPYLKFKETFKYGRDTRLDSGQNGNMGLNNFISSTMTIEAYDKGTKIGDHTSIVKAKPESPMFKSSPLGKGIANNAGVNLRGFSSIKEQGCGSPKSTAYQHPAGSLRVNGQTGTGKTGTSIR